MEVPETHDLIFVQGGGSLVFAMVALNLAVDDKKIGYIITGAWSKKAYEEGKKLFGDRAVVLVDTKASNYSALPENLSDVLSTVTSDEYAYVHYCDNETISGVEFPISTGESPLHPLYTLKNKQDAPILISDMSSNFCSRPVDIKSFGLVYGGVQKNLGPAGAAVCIIRKDLLSLTNKTLPVPTYLSFKIHADNESMYNTPPCWTIYICGLMAKYLLGKGGLSAIDEQSKLKANALYEAIDNSNDFYSCPTATNARSRMNVPFRLVAGNDKEAAFEKEFLADGLSQHGLSTLAGHRSVGGCRASLYNGMPFEGVQTLVNHMLNFQKSKQQ